MPIFRGTITNIWLTDIDVNHKYIYQANQTNNNLEYNPKVNRKSYTTKPIVLELVQASRLSEISNTTDFKKRIMTILDDEDDAYITTT